MNLGLQRIKALLGYLGDPHKQLRCLHIGGSNGKGSTAALAASVLQSAGYRVGLYTSPYLRQFTDRMSVNGKEIPKERLAELVSVVRPLVEKIAQDPSLGHPTEFEVVTAIALTYFAEINPILSFWNRPGRPAGRHKCSFTAGFRHYYGEPGTHRGPGKYGRSYFPGKAGIIKGKTAVVTQVSGAALAVIEEICRGKMLPFTGWGTTSGEKWFGAISRSGFPLLWDKEGVP